MGKRAERGFSLVELMVVVAVALVVAAIAMPNVVTAMQNYRLRSAASQVNALLQNARFQAVRTNQFVSVEQVAQANGQVMLRVLRSDLTVAPVQPVVLPRGITIVRGAAPSAEQLGFAATEGLPLFNPRGVPCVQEGTFCNSRPAGGPSAYVLTLQGVRSFGGPGFRAVAVSPTGRLQQWGRTGYTWTH